MEKRVIPWERVHGDQTLRLDYALSSDSVVFDLGGFEGQWTSDIFSKFRCTVHVFEPVPHFADRIRKRFEKNPQILVYPFGLAGRTTTAEVLLDGDRSSIYGKNLGRENKRRQSLNLVNMQDFIAEHQVKHIDLMKINIEGGEYDLLEYMLGAKLLVRIINLQLQFHDTCPDAIVRMGEIQTGLSSTHVKTWGYEFVWENWALKELSRDYESR